MKYLPAEGMNVALQSNAKWLRLEEKLAAKPTDEVSRWVQLYFMEKTTAAKNASFNDAHHAAENFIIPFIFNRHATSSEHFVPTFPSKGKAF